MSEKMLVTTGLNELKTLDARISRTIHSAQFIAVAKTSEKKVTPSVTKEEFNASANSSYDSINALINRADAIKAAIVESNAKTKIELCGETVSVAKAIDMKLKIAYKESLLNAMKNQFAKAQISMNSANARIEDEINNLVITTYGKESKQTIKENDYAAIADPYRERKETSLVDPLGLEKKIEELENYIEEFKATVDSKLQISNCITYIEF